MPPLDRLLRGNLGQVELGPFKPFIHPRHDLVGKQFHRAEPALAIRRVGVMEPHLQQHAKPTREFVLLHDLFDDTVGVADKPGAVIDQVGRIDGKIGRCARAAEHVSDVQALGDNPEVVVPEAASKAVEYGLARLGLGVRDIDFPEGVLVGTMLKGEEVVRPTGSTKIDEGDVITLFAMADDVPEVERLLQVSIDFF